MDPETPWPRGMKDGLHAAFPSRARDPGRAGCGPPQGVPACGDVPQPRGCALEGPQGAEASGALWGGRRAPAPRESEGPPEATGGVTGKRASCFLLGMTWVPDSWWGLSRMVRRCPRAFCEHVNFVHLGHRFMSLMKVHLGSRGCPPPPATARPVPAFGLRVSGCRVLPFDGRHLLFLPIPAHLGLYPSCPDRSPNRQPPILLPRFCRAPPAQVLPSLTRSPRGTRNPKSCHEQSPCSEAPGRIDRVGGRRQAAPCTRQVLGQRWLLAPPWLRARGI